MYNYVADNYTLSIIFFLLIYNAFLAIIKKL